MFFNVLAATSALNIRFYTEHLTAHSVTDIHSSGSCSNTVLSIWEFPQSFKNLAFRTMEIPKLINTHLYTETTPDSETILDIAECPQGFNSLQPVERYKSVNWVKIGLDNGLLPVQCQAFAWTNARLLSTGSLLINFSEMWNKVWIFSVKKKQLRMSPEK